MKRAILPLLILLVCAVRFVLEPDYILPKPCRFGYRMDEKFD